jgi:proteasome alpha subunit
VGKYNEFENLRVAGVRYADLRGYSYDRSDVTARGLANAYAQTLGAVFTQESKPYEVEIVVAEVGASPEADQIYRLTYDGSVGDEHGFVVMGGAAEQIEVGLREGWHEGMTLADALRLAVGLLGSDPAGGPDRELGAGSLEVAVLDRNRPRRTFRRITGHLLERLLSTEDPTSDAPTEDDDIDD